MPASVVIMLLQLAFVNYLLPFVSAPRLDFGADPFHFNAPSSSCIMYICGDRASEIGHYMTLFVSSAQRIKESFS